VRLVDGIGSVRLQVAAQDGRRSVARGHGLRCVGGVRYIPSWIKFTQTENFR